MNILITGGAGFIGRHVVKMLIKDHKITVIDDFSNSSHNNMEEFRNLTNFKLIEKNILNINQIDKNIISEIDVCIHLAAKINVQESLDNPLLHFNTNIIGTINLLELCRKYDINFITCGTCMVYDLSISKPINEQHLLLPKSPYAASKLAGEELAMSYYRGYGLHVTIVRPFNTYGPYQKSNQEGGVVSIFIKRYLNGEKLEIYGDGKQTRDLMYVDDCARFFVHLIDASSAGGETYNIGTGKDITIEDLALLICKDPSRIRYVPHPHPQSEINKMVCDYTKAKYQLGWEPKISLHEGIEKVIKWMSVR